MEKMETEMEINGKKWNVNGKKKWNEMEKNETEMEKMQQKWNQNGKNGNVPTPPTPSPEL